MSLLKAEKLRPDELRQFVSWLENSNLHHTVGIGNGPTRTPSVQLFVYPFNINMATGAIAKASASTAANTALFGKVTGHCFNSVQSGQFSLGIYRFSASRLVHKTGVLARDQPKTSHRTGRSYGSKGGASMSVPFGKSIPTANEEEVDVFELLKAGFETGGALPATERVTLTKEKFSILSE